MQFITEQIGTDVGALVVEDHGVPVLIIDPRLSTREQVRLAASLLTDEEFTETFPVYPLEQARQHHDHDEDQQHEQNGAHQPTPVVGVAARIASGNCDL